MEKIDLRSDTITLPTEAMRKAMAQAQVGDDVFGEDPTVNRLEEMAAGMMGKEAALFVSSGTMGNLICQLTHCGRGDEILLGDQAHVFFYEQGGSAAIGGLHSRTLPNQPDGTIDLADIENAIRPDNIHFPRSRLLLLENTHNRCLGTPLNADYMDKTGNLAKKHGIKLHVDGARIFNAAVALDVDASKLVRQADSVTFCLSKALAAPVGSVVCGTRSFIESARRTRKVLGGGMRQAGIIAAAGVVALTEMVDRLAVDHDNAKALARGLEQIDGIHLRADDVKTNIVFFDLSEDGPDAAEFAVKLDEEGVRVLPLGPRRLRAVLNYHITGTDVEKAIERFGKAAVSSLKN